MSEDTFKILVATDNHLGYMEKDGLRGKDSFVTFEEILQIGVKENVDFILLGGDLFHENKPSVSAVHKCMELLRKYTLGDKPVEFEFLSDPALNFEHNRHFPWVNYEDPNLNVAYPVFSIHGNHDDPLGPDAECALDIFSACGLVNLFGKYTSVQKIEIAPILLKKGTTRLALYGLGSVRDERLHRMFTHDQVSMLRPQENKQDWFSIFTVHQNRARHGATNYLPEQFLDDFLDLVIWGHEHDCRIDPEWNSQQNFFVCQPGSSVATSLSEGEAGEKHVGILEVRGREFKMRKVRLQTVRPFMMDEIFLEDIDNLDSTDANVGVKVQTYCQKKVEEMINQAAADATEHPRQPQEPLIRLRIDYSGGFDTFSAQRFGQTYVEMVANPKDMVNFHRRRDTARRESGLGGMIKLDGELDGSIARLSSALDSTRVEDLVRQFFVKGDDKVQMNLLTEKELGLAVQTFVEKDAKDAITRVVDVQVTRARKRLCAKNVRDLEDIMLEISSLKEEKERTSAQEDEEDTDVIRALREAAKAAPAAGMESEDDDVEGSFAEPNGRPARGRGSRGGRGGRGRGRKTTAAHLFDDDEEPPVRKSAARGRRGRAAGNSTLEAAFGRSRTNQRSRRPPSDDELQIVDDSDDEVSVTSGSSSRTRKRRRSDSDDNLDFASIRRKR